MKSSRWDITTLFMITLTGLACHLIWERLETPAIFGSTVAIAILLGLWTGWVWRRCAYGLTKFFSVAAILDLAAEGFLRPYHGETATAKILCQMTLFAVYAFYLGVLQPFDTWRMRSTRTTSITSE